MENNQTNKKTVSTLQYLVPLCTSAARFQPPPLKNLVLIPLKHVPFTGLVALRLVNTPKLAKIWEARGNDQKAPDSCKT